MLASMVAEVRHRFTKDPFKASVLDQQPLEEYHLLEAADWASLLNSTGLDSSLSPLECSNLKVSTVFPGMFLHYDRDGLKVVDLDAAVRIARRWALQASQR